jgi:type I restriction enzyme, S subunit
MSEWKKVTTTEIAEVILGATPSTNVQEYWDGDIEWVTPVDLSKLKSRFLISTFRKISKKGLENSSTHLIPAFNIVMSSRAPIGYFAIPIKNFTTNQGCKSFKLYPNHDTEYFYYNFLFYIDYFKRYGSGSTFLEISKTDIEKLSFFVPIALTEQRKIAHILSLVDTVIEKTEAAIAKYEAIKADMMHDLFTRSINIETGKLRPSYEESPELYKESKLKLGWIPKDWNEECLSRLTTQIGDGIHTIPKYSTNTHYFFINGNNLIKGKIVIPSECPCVDEEEYKKHFIDLNNRTILYSINGTIGNIALYDSERVILGKSVAYISCSKKIDLGYIYFNYKQKQ